MPADDAEASTHLALAPSGETQHEIQGMVMQRLFGHAAPPERRLGRYRVRKLLGRGAMGAVYTAHDPDLDREVALKVLHADIAAAERASLVAEAKAMARLNHRNVVAVYDVGEHEGQIFVAMERVKGETLRAWGSKPRAWRAVANVYRQAALGLAAAHDAGVVHRDFKPDNALVAADGRVMVADFGLARVGEAPRARVDQSLNSEIAGSMTDSEAADATRTLAGTPAYLAPEAIRGEASGPRSDQFAFAVSLWESLYGQRPFVGKSIDNLLIRITDGQRDAPPTDAVVPARLAAIVQRGLATDPQARFSSMHAMADALQRCLVPLHRRLRGVAVLLAVAAGVGVGAWGYGEVHSSRCDDEAGAAAAVWDDDAARRVRGAVLETKAGYAEATADRVADHLDRWRDRWAAGRRDACTTRADDAWAERRAHCYDRRLGALRGLVDVLAQADAKIAEHALDAATGLAEPDECRDDEYLRAAGVLPPSDVDARRVQAVREALARAEAFTFAGKDDEAMSLADAQRAEATELAYPALEADVLLAIGTVRANQGDYDAAAVDLEKAFAVATESGAVKVAAEAGLELARLDLRRDQEREGRVWARVTKGHLDRLGPTGLRLSVSRLRILANLEENLGNLETALELVDEAKALADGKLDPNDSAATALLSLEARIRGQRREFSRSIPMLRETISRIETREGEGHPAVIPAMMVLAQALSRTGQLDDGDDIASRVLAITESVYGVGHPEHARALQNLGVIRMLKGELDDAAALLERALQLRAKAYGPGSRATLGPLTNLAIIEMDRGNFEKALRYSDQRIDGLRASEQPDPNGLAHALLNRAATKEKLERFDDAIADLDAALETLDAAPNGGGLLRGHVLYGRAVTRQAAGRIDDALADAKGAIAVLDPTLELTDPRFRSALGTLGDLLERAGEREEAARVLQRAIDAYEAHDPEAPDAGRAYFARARLEGDRSWAVRASTIVPDGPDLDEIRVWLANHEGGRKSE